MKNLIALAALVALTGCSQLNNFLPGDTYLEVGAGKNSSPGTVLYDWYDSGGIGCSIELRQEVPVHDRVAFALRYLHVSHCDVGPPFNDKPESTLDHVGATLRFRISK